MTRSSVFPAHPDHDPRPRDRWGRFIPEDESFEPDESEFEDDLEDDYDDEGEDDDFDDHE